MGSLRRRVVLFVLGACAVAAVLPVVNVARRGGPGGAPEALFDTGFAWSAFSGTLRRIGVSTRPQQVIVGKSGWLFLGDQYAHALTDKRRPADAGDVAAAGRIAAAMQSWSGWLAARGVADWHVLVCADKDAIYADRLPDWVHPVEGAPIDVLVQRADARIVVDSRPALREARALAGPELYLRTDSHWTARGAWIAYRTLARRSGPDAGGVAWLQEADVRLRPGRQASGDLARLLQVADPQGDDAAVLAFVRPLDAGRTQVDAFSGRALDAAALAAVEAPTAPILVRSPAALNRRRMLWLRDSFGTALLPYLAATFTELVEVDRASTTPARLADLVRRLKPDAVLVSVAERNARAAWFEALPPAPGR